MNISGMRIRLAAFLILILAVSYQVSADSQWDIGLNVPYYAGLQIDGDRAGDFSDNLFLLPDVKWNYYWGSEQFRVGAGLRLWTLIIESAIYPIISLESNLGDFVLNANFGGGLFLVFGLYNDVTAGGIFVPEVSVAYRLGKQKRFQLGTGAMFVLAPEVADLSNFAYIGTVFARWTF